MLKKMVLIPVLLIALGQTGVASTNITGQAEAAAKDNSLTVMEILRKVDEAEAVSSSRGIMRQTITTTSGAKRIMEMETYSRDGTDKQLMRYTKPARVKGEAILMLKDGDEIWYFSPRTDRVRKLASHAKKKKVMGSDFSYEDMGGGGMARKYNGKLLDFVREGKKKCYHLELVPTPEGPSYSKIEIWVGRDDFIIRRVDYWDKGKKPYKRLIVSDVKKIENRWTPMKYYMKNLKEGSETWMEVKEISFDVDLPVSLFSERNLKRR